VDTSDIRKICMLCDSSACSYTLDISCSYAEVSHRDVKSNALLTNAVGFESIGGISRIFHCKDDFDFYITEDPFVFIYKSKKLSGIMLNANKFITC